MQKRFGENRFVSEGIPSYPLCTFHPGREARILSGAFKMIRKVEGGGGQQIIWKPDVFSHFPRAAEHEYRPRSQKKKKSLSEFKDCTFSRKLVSEFLQSFSSLPILVATFIYLNENFKLVDIFLIDYKLTYFTWDWSSRGKKKKLPGHYPLEPLSPVFGRSQNNTFIP
ncbi:hypothetical protein H1C71_034835 [Ictidomys tridecemlineatus]|nr:hypothetical protein H1C71_034835 [Ictidomys tridecemlineatus]